MRDQVNSSSVVLDSSGNVVGEMRYYPFGEMRVTSGSLFTDKLYTGQRQMAGLGLYDYNARLPAPGSFGGIRPSWASSSARHTLGVAG